MKLIPNWRRAHRMASMQFQAAGVAFLLWWQSGLAPDLKEAIGTTRALWILGVFFALGLIGRVVYQPAAHEKPSFDEETP